MTAENEILDPHKVNYCIEASQWFQNLVEEDDCQDWRSVRASHALKTGVDLDSRSPMKVGGTIKTD